MLKVVHDVEASNESAGGSLRGWSSATVITSGER